MCEKFVETDNKGRFFRKSRICTKSVTVVITPRSVNPKYTDLILEIKLGLELDLGIELTLISHKTDLKPNPNPNLISRIKFVYLRFTEHGIITQNEQPSLRQNQFCQVPDFIARSRDFLRQLGMF